MYAPLLILASLVAHVLGHARVTTPTPRKIGAATQAACGSIVTSILTSDLTGPLENAQLGTGADPNYNAAACHLFFCRGAQFADNTANTRVYKAGTVVPFHVDLVAHHTGWANVSVVNLVTQKPIARLFTWPVYANESLGPPDWPANETDFSVTVPNLGTQCSQSGVCAIQWWWYSGFSNLQTYENCIDFTQ
ncbi:Chitin binding [Mycena kentingensis (nom. inval.)]|nr:Chitin binding [Mycena kentingensis (nom. inval.)]